NPLLRRWPPRRPIGTLLSWELPRSGIPQPRASPTSVLLMDLFQVQARLVRAGFRSVFRISSLRALMGSNLCPFQRVSKRSFASLGLILWWSACWGRPLATLTSVIDSALCGNLRGIYTLLIWIKAASWSSSPSNKITLRRLRGGPWILLDHYLVVHQWDPSFRVSNDLPKRMVAWIRFPHLPIHLYHGQVLTALGNLVGKTVKIDSTTQTVERGKFARIAVEIDLDKPLPPVVLLDGAIQQVEYENLPQLCFDCGLVGHERLSCPRRADPAAPETGVQATSSAMAIGSPAPAPAADSYGPWMLVSRRSRRPAKVSGAAKEGTTATPRADNQAGSSKSFKAGESVQIPAITGPTIAKSVATGNEVLLVEPSGPGVKVKRKPKKRTKAKSADGLHQPSTGVKQASIGPNSSAQDKLASVGPDVVMTPPPLSGLATQVGATSPQPSPSPEQRSPAATTPSQPGVAVELSVPSPAPAITSLTGTGGPQAIPDGPNGPADPCQTPLFANFCVPPAARAALSSDRSVTSAKFRRPQPEPAKTRLSLKPAAVVDRKSSSGLSKKPVKAKVVREALKITDPLATSTAPIPVDLSVFLRPDGGPVNGATGDVEMTLNEVDPRVHQEGLLDLNCPNSA
ncbi:hypothetical protein LINPERHAP2_LOCUS36912, partial [Linum perenne]